VRAERAPYAWFQNGPLRAGGGGGEEDAEAAEGGAAEAAEGDCPATDEAEKAAAWAATDDPDRAARHAKIRALLGCERTGPGRPPPRPEAETQE